MASASLLLPPSQSRLSTSAAAAGLVPASASSPSGLASSASSSRASSASGYRSTSASGSGPDEPRSRSHSHRAQSQSHQHHQHQHHQHRPTPLPLKAEDRSHSWHSEHSEHSAPSSGSHLHTVTAAQAQSQLHDRGPHPHAHARGRQARTPPVDPLPTSAASASGSTPHTATGFRHRKASMDVDAHPRPFVQSHSYEPHHAQAGQRHSVDLLRQKSSSQSRDRSPSPHSAKSVLSAHSAHIHLHGHPQSGGRQARFPPRPPRLTHSLSDAPPALRTSRAGQETASGERKTLWARVRPWSLAALWVLTTLGFLVAIAFWKQEVFSGLDHLATWLREHGVLGYFLLYTMIFITTIPPLPMYSTLITLAGYCFGTWMGAVVSYAAALTGAVVVFVVSRECFPGAVHKTISASPSFKKVIRAIEKRPRLLFLIRLAPYPYNMMNVLLSSSPYLTLSTYTLVTALSLFKCLIYTYVGSAIHSFADYHTQPPNSSGKEGENTTQQQVMHIWGIVGVVLCVGIMGYLMYLARRAVNDVDEEVEDQLERGGVALRDEEGEGEGEGEGVPFLGGGERTASPMETNTRSVGLGLGFNVNLRTSTENTDIPSYRTGSLLSRPPTPAVPPQPAGPTGGPITQ